MAIYTAAGRLADVDGRLNPLLPHPMEILVTAAVLMLLLVVGVSAFLAVRSSRRALSAEAGPAELEQQ